jgi:hypothetical protein
MPKRPKSRKSLHPSYSITNLVTLSYESIKKTLSITTTIEPVDGATIEMYNSSSRHPINGWLEGCNDDPNNQIVDENDTQTETRDETVQEDGPTMKFWIPRRLIREGQKDAL